ncbi:MAG TPA: type I secretion system permease/ATPase [Candidatus Competibacter sp.]|nr:type I secretion system permease/ATPase [Candidatus Competibacter sp.]
MRTYLRQCGSYFAYAGLFSLFINLLLLTTPLYSMQVFDRVLTSRSVETLLVLTLLAVGALLTQLALEIVRGRLLLAAGAKLERLLGPAVLEGTLRQALHSTRTDVAGLNDVAQLRGFLSGGTLTALFDAPWAPLYLAVIALVNPGLGGIAFGGALLLALLAYLNERLTRVPLGDLHRHARAAGNVADSAAQNAEVVQALGMLPALRRRWERASVEVLNAWLRAGRASGTVSAFSRCTRMLIQIAIMGGAALLVIEQTTTSGVMLASTLLLARALAPVETAIGGWKALVEARAAYRRLDALLATRQTTPTTALPAPTGALTVNKLSYFAPGADRPLLQSVTFALEPGKALGVIGSSGSGKSTLARLIAGSWRPSGGEIRLDGAELRQWSRERLGRHVGYLPQDVQLFAGTVAENIARLGEAGPEQIVAAARWAHAHEMILRLPQGYDTRLGPGGAGLSGGQRQRIALARAVYGRPRLIVLDEPDASLDGEGEEALRATLRALRTAGATVIVVSHRTALLPEMDALLVLKDGQPQLFGSREEVLKRLRGGNAVAPQVIRGGKP